MGIGAVSHRPLRERSSLRRRSWRRLPPLPRHERRLNALARRPVRFPAVSSPRDLADAAAAELLRRTGVDGFDVAVVLGSGWAPAAAELGEPSDVVPMAELPGFSPPTAAGHGGSLLAVPVGDKRVLVLLGRIHAYEGHDLQPRRASRADGVRGRGGHRRADQCGGRAPRGLRGGPARADQRPPQPDGAFTARGRAVRRSRRRLCASAAGAGQGVDPTFAEGVYAGLPGPALRDARRDPDVAHARRGPGRHVDRARDHRRAGRGRRGARRSRW